MDVIVPLVWVYYKGQFLCFFRGQFFVVIKKAAVLATMFVVVTFLREILEPKLFGTAANIKPLYVLIAVYAGVELFGVAGILLGPVGLIILRSLAEDYVVG